MSCLDNTALTKHSGGAEKYYSHIQFLYCGDVFFEKNRILITFFLKGIIYATQILSSIPSRVICLRNLIIINTSLTLPSCIAMQALVTNQKFF